MIFSTDTAARYRDILREAGERGLTGAECAEKSGAKVKTASHWLTTLKRKGYAVSAADAGPKPTRYFDPAHAAIAATWDYGHQGRTRPTRGDCNNKLRAGRRARQAFVFGLIEAAGRAGIGAQELRDATGTTSHAMNKLLKGARDGIVVLRSGVLEWRYFTVENAPKKGAKVPTTAAPFAPSPTTSIREARRKLDSDQPTIVPPTARITRIPTVLDHRHTVRSLAPGHVSVLDSRECRGWALEVVR